MRPPIMAHLILGYPSVAASLKTAEQYIEAGCAILELQIPFSHPTADGPVITQACRDAVEHSKVDVQECLYLIGQLRQKYPTQEIIVMSYLNRVFTYGLPQFCTQLKAMQISHLIVPDLPVDCPQADIIRQNGVELVPVLAANVSPLRLERLLSRNFSFYYLMSDFKITGSTFSLNPNLQQVIERIKADKSQPRIGIGFGISTPEQVKLVTSVVDYAIIGSAFIKAEKDGHLTELLASMLEIA